ncbi:uncharacterized protein LY89DRAFT_726888 [Mollisia scopiformis]|uniref:Uncharacterized protein n=1 Tax=Mollisia scopiformis TaxID=149040 RepID=A0A194XUL7_MOLSC|nr:uncharacterized protein LY89DRAFT_726888 [Mollisia scopiformis]KUJ23831.1 hypothetical protein LY89DRAFT_726888 [Mollisia scopiformis]
MVQLLADCLPNHTSGMLDHDFVYLEAHVNKLKGGYFYHNTPKSLTGYPQKPPSNLNDLKELWTALTLTILVFGYLNDPLVVSKYNCVSQRMRKMLEEIARQSREDRSPTQQWALWDSWEPFASSERLVKIFNSWERGFLNQVEKRMQKAVRVGLNKIAAFEPMDQAEAEFHAWCKQKLGCQAFGQSPRGLGLALSMLDQTRKEKEDWISHDDQTLDEHVSQTELGELDADLGASSTNDVETEDLGQADGGGSIGKNWAANWLSDEETMFRLLTGAEEMS